MRKQPLTGIPETSFRNPRRVFSRRAASNLFRYAAALAAVACATHAANALAADWYVDGKNGNDRNAGTRAAPFLTVWHAWSSAQPGDTVRVLPTVTYGPIWLGDRSGLPGAPITVRGEGAAGNMTKVSGMGQNFGINAAPGVNYINIENFDVTAPGHGNNSGWSAIYLAGSHHVSITGNTAHDSGCAGIQAYGSDYVTISGNRVANNSKDTWNRVFCSGISNHENLDVDGSTDVKMRIENNVVWGNTNTPSPGCSAPCTDSDGSGIIVDDNRRSQTDRNAYRGRTLIRNNVVFRNGGRGIAIYYSNAVDIQGNTVYLNNQDPDEGSWRPGEIGITFSGDVTATGNVLYSDGAAGTANTGAHVAVQVTDCAGGGPISVSGNVGYNPQNDNALFQYTRRNAVAVSIAGNTWRKPYLAPANTSAN